MTLTDAQFDELQNNLKKVKANSIFNTFVGKNLAGVEFVWNDENICDIILYFNYYNEDSNKILALAIGTMEDENYHIPPLTLETAEMNLKRERSKKNKP